MAVPVTPIEVWASSTYELPNAHTTNKIRPINDLWLKGYDKGQRPDVQAWNYVWNMQTAWVKYLAEEQIPGLDNRFLKKDLNLSDLADKPAARINLGVYSTTQADGKFVDVGGDTMTGPLTAPRFNLVASSTDVAYITTTNPATDVTYFDFVVGDNIGQAGTGINDSMRFRFENASTGTFTMLELNAIGASTALARLSGDFIASGSVTASSATINGVLTTSSLSVSSNTATVGGRNIVRQVNGQTADGNGNVTISFPDPGVTDIRLSEEIQMNNTQFTPFSQGRRASAPAGAFLCAVADNQTGKIYLEDIDVIWYRYVQKQIGGVWYNVATL